MKRDNKRHPLHLMLPSVLHRYIKRKAKEGDRTMTKQVERCVAMAAASEMGKREEGKGSDERPSRQSA